MRASATENADLFWAVRGGGGNFGVATAFEFRLHEVGPTVLGGIVAHRLDRARAAFDFYREYSRLAPDPLSADGAFLTSPDGDPVFAVSICYSGPRERGERVLEPIRRFGPPLVDLIAPVPYLEVQKAADALFPPGLHYHWQSHFFQEIAEEAAEATIDQMGRVPSPRSLILFQQYGGAVGRVGRSETAFWHRDAEWDGLAASIWSPPADPEVHRRWAREWWERVRPSSLGGEYVNNLGDEGDDRVRGAYGENFSKLAALKSRYDPENLFRLNANIKPAGDLPA